MYLLFSQTFSPEHSYDSLLAYHGLSSAAPVHEVGSGSKSSSALSAHRLVYQQSKISSRGSYPLQDFRVIATIEFKRSMISLGIYAPRSVTFDFGTP